LYTIGLIKLNGKVVSSEIELLSEVKRFLDGGTFSD
ncbi:nucleoside 2-deoxyribosyltransferase, partial [Enterococcus faecium]